MAGPSEDSLSSMINLQDKDIPMPLFATSDLEHPPAAVVQLVVEEEEEEEDKNHSSVILDGPMATTTTITMATSTTTINTTGHENNNNNNNNPPPPPPGMGKPPTKFLFLDGLRGLAAIQVVLVHSSYMDLFAKQKPGAWAVDTFFVLSAFLLTMLFDKKAHQLVQTKASAWTWCISVLDYFQRRFLRVYPLFAIIAMVLAVLPQDLRWNYYCLHAEIDLVTMLTFTHIESWDYLFWTLPLEIKYYFIIPLVVVVMMALGRKWWIPVGPVFVWVFYSAAYDHLDGMPLHAKLHVFVSGSMSAIVYARTTEIMQRNNFEFNKWHRLALRVIEYITFAYLLSTCTKGLLFDWLFANPFPRVDEESERFIALHMCILIVIEMLSPSEFSQCLEWNVWRAWGKISFSVYLLHPVVVFRPSMENEPNRVNRLIGELALVYVVGTISYHAIELPMQKAAWKLSRFLSSKTIHEFPYQVVPKFSQHFSGCRSREKPSAE